MKTCTKCGETKTVAEFGKHSHHRDGLQSHCKVCKRAADAARIAANPELNREKASAWYAANPEKARASRAKWYTENIDTARANNAKWRAENSEKVLARVSAWQAANPDKKRAYCAKWAFANPENRRATAQNRRAAKIKATPSWFSDADRKTLLALCAEAKSRELATGESWHVDHIIPLQGKTACGLHIADNWQLLPAKVNLSKSNKLDFQGTP